MITNEWIPGKDNYDVALDIRKKVFGNSAKDAFDDFAMHLVVYESDNPVACGRLYVGEDNCFCVSHVCVLEKFRKKGLGDLTSKLLLYRGFEFTGKIYAEIPENLVPYYLKYGFKKCGNRYMVKKDEVIYPSKCGGHKSL